MDPLTPCKIQDVVDSGILMEVNRTFLHPLGFTIQAEVVNDVMALTMLKTDDPEGISYRSSVSDEALVEITKRLEGFKSVQKTKHEAREAKMGYVVQDSLSNQPEAALD